MRPSKPNHLRARVARLVLGPVAVLKSIGRQARFLYRDAVIAYRLRGLSAGARKMTPYDPADRTLRPGIAEVSDAQRVQAYNNTMQGKLPAGMTVAD